MDEKLAHHSQIIDRHESTEQYARKAFLIVLNKCGLPSNADRISVRHISDQLYTLSHNSEALTASGFFENEERSGIVTLETVKEFGCLRTNPRISEIFRGVTNSGEPLLLNTR